MRIGITADVNFGKEGLLNAEFASFVPRRMLKVAVKHDVLPVALPIVPDHMAADYVSLVDAVIIPGGPDVAPRLYGEDPHPKIGQTYYPRDAFELEVIQECIRSGKPLLGICRGVQIINVALGGTVYQDLDAQYPNPVIQHEQATEGFFPTHYVQAEQGSFVADAMGTTHPLVNSRHHQAVKDLGEGLHVTSRANDGVIESIENDDQTIVGIQWHPENLWETIAEEEALFTHFFDKMKEV
ncbi:gamma-glutamyl-gamma-aminobutyrate hydrolase family protein [Leuconostocaceae bacterium ESL0723]|nr:gamma-glutamyl-gamma-aminobutyrate hydrolase family protein [Leuconostocaceae bacterium ESL0723]